MATTRRQRWSAFAAAILLLAGAAGIVSFPAASAASAASNTLAAVTCTSPRNCFAVGVSSASSAGPDKTLIEQWNGKTWAIVSSPNPEGASRSSLAGVSCANESDCFAVGHQVAANSKGNTLIEHWNGKTWSIVSSPNSPVPGSDNQLTAVSCTSKTFCVAVGTERILKAGTVILTREILQRWNGTAWSMGSVRHVPVLVDYELNGVSCTSTVNCFAVGSYASPTHEPGSDGNSTLSERWNGKAWHVVTSPNPGIGSGAYLLGVSCTSSPNCVAAGQYFIGGVAKPATLSERWDGTEWKNVSGKLAPNRSYNALNGISCTSTSNCMATGWYSRPTTPAVLDTFIERWNGKGWTVVESANVAGSFNILNGVWCVSASSCMAVGYSFGTGPNQTLVQRWNGRSWKIVPSPNR